MLWAFGSATGTPTGGCLPGRNPHNFPIDPNGNLTTKTEGSDNWTYSWNAENQLVRVEKNGVDQARFAYDPLGRRVEKVAGGVTTAYTYDDMMIVREDRGGVTLKYVQGPAMDEVLAVDDGTALSYFHADTLGSIVKMTDGSGAVTLTRQYDAWGNLEVGASEPGFSFTGREWGPESGLYYYRTRYYDPTVGRFTSADPLRFAAGVNFYTYVLNNPVRFEDPWGLDVYTCQRPMKPYWFGKAADVPHGFLWCTSCNQSYSFSSSGIDPNDNPNVDPNGRARPPYQCTPTLEKPNECFEKCICRLIQEHMKKAPKYSAKNNCWDQMQRVEVLCKVECRLP